MAPLPFLCATIFFFSVYVEFSDAASRTEVPQEASKTIAKYALPRAITPAPSLAPRQPLGCIDTVTVFVRSPCEETEGCKNFLIESIPTEFDERCGLPVPRTSQNLSVSAISYITAPGFPFINTEPACRVYGVIEPVNVYAVMPGAGPKTVTTTISAAGGKISINRRTLADRISTLYEDDGSGSRCWNNTCESFSRGSPMLWTTTTESETKFHATLSESIATQNYSNTTTERCEQRPTFTQSALNLFKAPIIKEYTSCGSVKITVANNILPTDPDCHIIEITMHPTVHNVQQYITRNGGPYQDITITKVIGGDAPPGSSIKSDPPVQTSQRAPAQNPATIQRPPIPMQPAPSSHGVVLPNGETLLPGSVTKISTNVVSVSRASPSVVFVNGVPFDLSQTRHDLPSTPSNLGLTLPNWQQLNLGSSGTYKGHTIYISPTGDLITIDGVPIDNFYSIDLGALGGLLGSDSLIWAMRLPDGEFMFLGALDWFRTHHISFEPGQTTALVDGIYTIPLGVPISSLPKATGDVSAAVQEAFPSTEDQGSIVFLPDGSKKTLTDSSTTYPTGGPGIFEGKSSRVQMILPREQIFLPFFVVYVLLDWW